MLVSSNFAKRGSDGASRHLFIFVTETVYGVTPFHFCLIYSLSNCLWNIRFLYIAVPFGEKTVRGLSLKASSIVL